MNVPHKIVQPRPMDFYPETTNNKDAHLNVAAYTAGLEIVQTVHFKDDELNNTILSLSCLTGLFT